MASSAKGIRTLSADSKSVSNMTGRRELNSASAAGHSSLLRRQPSPSLRKRSVPPRAKSVYGKPSNPQTRTLKDNMTTATVFKTNSDTSLAKNMRNLSITERVGSANARTGARSRVTSAGRRGCRTIEDIAQQILSQQVKNIVVMAGAGISTASGIPDFRTPGTGLYDNLRQYRIPYPEAIFDIDYFETTPKPFYTIAKELYPTGKYRPNYTHYFLRLLHEKGALLRVYTQNIDGLERLAGIPPQKLVEAHGTFLTSSCVKCKVAHESEDLKTAIFADKIPRCRRNGCYGLVKPDIVFFGEDLHKRFYYYLKDFPQADMLIVMGTSLEVEPFAGIVDCVRLYVPRVLFNREAVGPFEKKRRMNDVVSAGDIGAQLKKFVQTLGWEKDLEDLITNNEPNGLVEFKRPEKPASNHNNSANGALPPSGASSSHSRETGRGLTRPTRASHRLYNTHSAKTQVELLQMREMVRLGKTTKTSSTKPAPALPQLVREKPISFHCQKSLWRKSKGADTDSDSGPNSPDDDSSSEESSDSSDDD